LNQKTNLWIDVVKVTLDWRKEEERAYSHWGAAQRRDSAVSEAENLTRRRIGVVEEGEHIHGHLARESEQFGYN
jgi:hypothetical protein